MAIAPSPDDIDESPKLNDLRSFYCPDGWGKAHIFISRTGELLVGHDYSVAWRETKFEQAAEFGGALQGLFLLCAVLSRQCPSRRLRC
jgi:hypothetical protein